MLLNHLSILLSKYLLKILLLQPHHILQVEHLVVESYGMLLIRQFLLQRNLEYSKLNGSL